MGINFPSSPADGQVLNVSPGVSFVARGGVWRPAPLKTALPRNYLVNPAMQASQENGDAASAAAVSGSFYVADQWIAQWTFATGVFSVSRGRTSPAGGDYGTLSCSTVGTLAATSQFQFGQFMEGQRVADFQWGTIKAQQAIFNFNLIANFTGTYAVNIRNTDNTRAYLAPLVVPTANVWRNYTFAIPGDTTGTWANDNTRGMGIGFGFAAGSTYSGVAGWQGGLYIGLSGQNSIGANVGAVLIADLGFYLDPYLTGVAPPFAMPDAADEVRRSQRYWYRSFGTRGVTPSTVLLNALDSPHPVPMRIKPTLALVGAPKGHDGTTAVTITSISANQANTYAVEINTNIPTLVAGRPGAHIWDADANYVGVSARV